MLVHKYSYFPLLFNVKNLGKISKPPYIIVQCTRIEHISSLIYTYKESPELLIPEASPTVNSQYSACIPTVLESYCLANNFFLEILKFYLYSYSVFL